MAERRDVSEATQRRGRGRRPSRLRAARGLRAAGAALGRRAGGRAIEDRREAPRLPDRTPDLALSHEPPRPAGAAVLIELPQASGRPRASRRRPARAALAGLGTDGGAITNQTERQTP